jgi:hypothetical protein
VATDEITWSEEVYRIFEHDPAVPLTVELVCSRAHPKDIQLLYEMLDRARGDGSDIECEHRLQMPDHSVKYVNTVAHATRDQDGQLVYIAAVQDVTQHQLLEEALGKARSELARVARVTSLGAGANGKSTLLEVVRHVMGDYAQAAEFGTFVAKKDVRTGPSSDIAKMRGARFVSATEGEQQHKLAESLVKQLTGGETIAACFKFKEYFEFRPQFKLWLATNHKPVIGGTDDGIWRRIRLVPFTVSFADRDDKQLSDKLRRESPGILRWMVEGLKQWRLHGLMPPKEVLDATAQYHAERIC